MSDSSLVSKLAAVLTLKGIALLVLWWFFVRGHGHSGDAAQVAQHFLSLISSTNTGVHP